MTSLCMRVKSAPLICTLKLRIYKRLRADTRELKNSLKRIHVLKIRYRAFFTFVKATDFNMQISAVFDTVYI